jgi:hypothetical protein
LKDNSGFYQPDIPLYKRFWEVCDFQELYRYLIDDSLIEYCQELKLKDFSARADNPPIEAGLRGDPYRTFAAPALEPDPILSLCTPIARSAYPSPLKSLCIGLLELDNEDTIGTIFGTLI